MNLHLPSCYFCISMGWALHTAPAQISTPWALHLLEAIAASTFATPQLNFRSGPVSSPAGTLLPALRAGLQGLPEGPGFYLGTGTARGQAVEQHLATPNPEGHLPWGDCSQSKLQRCQKVPSLSFRVFFFPPSLPLTVVLFFIKLFQGTLIFVRTLISFLLDDKHL